MLRIDAMVDAKKPRLEVGEAEVNQREVVLCHLSGTALSDREMVEASLGEAGVALPVVGHDHGALFHRVVHEGAEALGAPVWNDRHAEPASVATATTGSGLAYLVRRLPSTYLDRPNHDDPMVDALALASGLATHVRLVQLHGELPADAVTVRADHPGAELVEDLKGRLVAGEPELPLELHGAHAGGHRGQEVGAPEPRAHRRVAVLHDRASHEPRFLLA